MLDVVTLDESLADSLADYDWSSVVSVEAIFVPGCGEMTVANGSDA